MRARVRDLFEPIGYPAFRRVWLSGLVAQLGDWACRLALAVMVFDRTGSALASAAALAVSIVPWLGPGQWITALTEKYPRRRVMVVADLVRAAVYVIATFGLPLPVMFALLFVAGLAAPPFHAARTSVLPELLPGPVFASSQALRGITDDVTLIGGYLLGGALLAVMAPQGALLANAAALVVSAALLRGLPPGTRPANDGTGSATRLAEAFRRLAGTPYLRRGAISVTVAIAAADTLVLLAVPHVVGELDRGPATVSWLVALACLVTVGATLLIPHRASGDRLMKVSAGLLAAGGLGTALALTASDGTVGLAIAFGLSGLLAAVMVPANIVVTAALPSSVRASALSVLMGSLFAAQAAVPVVSGAAADMVGVVPACGVVMLLAGLYGAWGLLTPVTVPDHLADPETDLPDGSEAVPGDGPVAIDLTRPRTRLTGATEVSA